MTMLLNPFFLLIFFCFVCGGCHKETKLTACLTEEERKDLDYLFRLLFIDRSGAFVLFGSKPLCNDGYFDHVVQRENSPYRRNPEKGWEAWEKLRQHVPVHRYILMKRPIAIRIVWPDQRVEEKPFQCIVLLDIQKTALVLAEHYDLFRQYVGMDFHPLEIVFDIENPNSVFWNRIFNFDKTASPDTSVPGSLIHGLLYGFGKQNSLLWTWETQLSSSNERVADFFKHAPLLSSYSDCEAEPLGRRKPDEIFVPGFKTIENSETVALYEKEKSQIAKIYKGHDFLETTLRQLVK